MADADATVKKFDLKKWILTRIPASGEQWGKWLDFLWKLAVVICVYIFIWLPVRDKFFSNKSAVGDRSVSTIKDNSGTILNSDDHATSTVVHNHSPLENGILGLIFGTKDQVVKEEKSKKY